jgi:hypothetical protein
MLQLNLFHEQQQIQRDKDLDPVRWTIVIGTLLVVCILMWALVIYWNMSGLRSDLLSNQNKLKELEKQLPPKDKRTNLTKIQSQAQALHNRVEYRALIATQFDILQDVVPTNCQVRVFKIMRRIDDVEAIIPGGKKGNITVRRKVPALDFVFEINTRGPDKFAVLLIRDNLIEILKKEPRYRPWIKQVTEKDGTNVWNEVSETTITHEPKGDELASGILNLKCP